MSAANTVVENGGRVVLLDKSSFCGGNSTKATSGINGAGGGPAKKTGGGHLGFGGGENTGGKKTWLLNYMFLLKSNPLMK